MTAVVTGDLYIYCPDRLANELRPQVGALYPGALLSEFSSDWETIFGLGGVSYPVEQARYTLASWHRFYAAHRALVYWSWVPPVGSVVLPGGTLGLACREEASTLVQEELHQWFPGAFVYTYPSEDGWQLSQVDTPPPAEDIYSRYVALARWLPSVSLHWQRWFDRVRLPDGNIVMVGEE